MKAERRIIKEPGLEIDDLEGTFDDLIARLQGLKEWSKTLRNPDTDEPDPNGVQYLGVNFGGPSGHGTALYYERKESDKEYEARMERLRRIAAKAKRKMKEYRDFL